MAKKSSSGKTIFRILALIGVILLIGLGLRLAGVIGNTGKEIEVDTSAARLKTITELVSSSGKIQPEIEVIIRPDVSGEIIELPVKEGDYVKKGDLLLRIKPDIYQANIDQLNAALLTQRARYEQAKASLLQAEAAFKKDSVLFERNVISDMDYTQTKSNFESQIANQKAAEYQIESAEAQLRRAREELQQTVIRAPQDGTVTGLDVELGERVLGNAQMAGTDMMRISFLDRMEVLVDVNENDIVKVSERDTARIEVDAYPERLFSGIVTEIANSAKVTGAGTNEQVTNYQVKVRILTPHNLDSRGSNLVKDEVAESNISDFVPNFRPGMSATVDIETATATGIVSVPIQAVTVRDFSKDEGNTDGESLEAKKEDLRKVVFKVKDGKAVRTEVTTGISDNTDIQILAGLDAGDVVVTGSYRVLSSTLKDGDQVADKKLKNQIAGNN